MLPKQSSSAKSVDLVVSSLSSQAGTDFVVRNIEARQNRQPPALLDLAISCNGDCELAAGVML